MNHIRVLESGRQQLMLRADLKFLSEIRMAVRAVCEPHTTNARAVAELELAVTELASNVIRHAYRGHADGWLDLDMLIVDGVFEFSLQHQGASFDSLSVEVPEITEPQEHGMGLFLIDQCVDNICYGTAPNGACHIRLNKALHPEPGRNQHESDH